MQAIMGSASLEQEMREALGLGEAKKKVITPKDRQDISFQKSKAADTVFSKGASKKAEKFKPAERIRTRLTYTVRKKTGGPTEYFTYESPSISVMEAEMMAKKELDKKGLVIWALLDRESLS